MTARITTIAEAEFALRVAGELLRGAEEFFSTLASSLPNGPAMRRCGASQAERIIARFGGISALARRLDRTASVVQGWKERGFIPGKRIGDVLRAGRELEPPLTPQEFFDSPKDAVSVRRGGRDAPGD